MKLAIVGHGRMGKEIEQQAKKISIPVSKILSTSRDLKQTHFSEDDIAIEFTSPESCIENIQTLAEKGVNIVCGTTGWDDNLDKVKNIIAENKIGFLYASNFSIGVHLFWDILARAAHLVNAWEQYDIMGHEFHHKNKKDSPSGTAISTAQILLENIQRKKNLSTEKATSPLRDDELHFSSTRGGHIFGQHSVLFDSPEDTIEITHRAKGRHAFARGAIECAKWLVGKKGFFEIDDFINEVYCNENL